MKKRLAEFIGVCGGRFTGGDDAVPYPVTFVCRIGGGSGNVDDFYAEFVPFDEVGLYSNLRRWDSAGGRGGVVWFESKRDVIRIHQRRSKEIPARLIQVESASGQVEFTLGQVESAPGQSEFASGEVKSASGKSGMGKVS